MDLQLRMLAGQFHRQQLAGFLDMETLSIGTTAAALTEAMGWFVAHRLAKGYEISDIMNDVNKEKNTQYYNPFEGRSAHNVKDDAEEEEYEEYEKVKDTAGDSIVWESDRYAEYNVEEDDNEDNNEERERDRYKC